MRQQREQLLARAAITNREQAIALLQHAQIAMHGFCGVQKKARRARARECRGNLCAHEPRLAHAAHDNLAARVVENHNRPLNLFFIEILARKQQRVCLQAQGLLENFNPRHRDS